MNVWNQEFNWMHFFHSCNSCIKIRCFSRFGIKRGQFEIFKRNEWIHWRQNWMKKILLRKWSRCANVKSDNRFIPIRNSSEKSRRDPKYRAYFTRHMKNIIALREKQWKKINCPCIWLRFYSIILYLLK